MIKEGKKVVDISELLDVFAAQEGEIQQLIGGIGQGKTYEATRRALEMLKEGKVVYTNWHLVLPDVFDQRKSLRYLFWNILFFRKRYYVIDYKKNWHYYDMDMPGIVDYIASLTDCTVFCDEGQDLFDSYEGTSMSKKKRKSITRTRHLRKTLVIVSQRAQAIAVTARANVNVFHKTEKIQFPFLPPLFKVRATEEMDNQNFPIWENAKVIHSHFAKKNVFNAYNSWYLSNGIPKSQKVYFDAFDLSVKESIINFSILFFGPYLKALKRFQIRRKTMGDNSKVTSIKIGERLNTIPDGSNTYEESQPERRTLEQALPF